MGAGLHPEYGHFLVWRTTARLHLLPILIAMKAFLLKCFCFALLILGSIFLVLTQGDGYTDAFYVRFTTPRQTSMILGSSRAAQGVVPRVLDSCLNRQGFFNFSFTIGDSPYGPTYLDAIRKKLDPDTRDAIFIVTVDPWTISNECPVGEDTAAFRELKGCLGETKNLNSRPNLQYLLSAFDKRYINLLTKNPQMYLHEDGWLEVTVDMDSASVKRRIQNHAANYRSMVDEYCISDIRIGYLEQTVTFLKKHGSVFLVRLPVHRSIMDSEVLFMPDFDAKIGRAISLSDGYLDLTHRNGDYTYVDGNHLYRKSSMQVSAQIAQWINDRTQVRVTRAKK